MQRLGTPALLLGLAGLVAGFVLRMYRPSWTKVWPALLILGGLVLLLGLYAVFATNVRRALAGRATRYGLNAAVLVVLILGVIALVEAVSYRHSQRWDLTENKRWSLSPQTIKVVGELPVPVKAVAFYRPDQPGKRTAEDLLKQYAGRSDGKFTLGGHRRGPEPLGGPAVQRRELRHGRPRGDPEGRADEAGEAGRAGGREADQRAHPGHAPGQAHGLLPQGPRREGPELERPHRLQPGEDGHRDAELRRQGPAPRARDQDSRRRRHRGRGGAAEGSPAERARRPGRVRGPRGQGAASWSTRSRTRASARSSSGGASPSGAT